MGVHQYLTMSILAHQPTLDKYILYSNIKEKIIGKMKKEILMLLFIAFSGSTFAQDTLRISAGLTLVPQGAIDLTNINGFKSYTNIFSGLTVSKGRWFNTTFYSFTFNQLGTAFGFNHNKYLVSYVVYAKTTTKSKSDYLGFGLGTPLAKGRATGFIETGSSTYKYTPGLYIGMFIPFNTKLR